MANKHDLKPWLVGALRALGGRGSVVEVSREIWARHEMDLRASGNLFFRWQYDVRWAAHELRRAGVLRSVEESPRGIWELR